MKTILIGAVLLALKCNAIHYPNYNDHECKRTCVKGETKMCRYELTAENMVLMPPECGNCPRNEMDCFNEQCLVADGGVRQALVYNRMLPGPMIEVCQNDTIDVLFRNNLIEQASSIHWHGIHQVGTPYMDGVPFITQCPTQTSTEFRYKFVARQKGTYFYHAHYADTVILTNGERMDVVINANQPVDDYWMIFTGSVVCDDKESLAFLNYKNTGAKKAPGRNESKITLAANRQLNCINAFSNESSCTFFYQLKYRGDIDSIALKPTADITYYFGYTLYDYVKPKYESYNTSLITNPAFNNITMAMPKRPMIFGDASLTYCNNETKSLVCDPKEALCDCTHVVKFPMGKTIEIILVNEGSPNHPIQPIHPIHLHGYGFRVLAEEKIGNKFYVDTFKELDAINKIKRNLDNPPIKDTINPPDGGYTILRIYTNNPGYWVLHCHEDVHNQVGMMVVLKVGDVIEEPPAHFPFCGSMNEAVTFVKHNQQAREKHKIPTLPYAGKVHD